MKKVRILSSLLVVLVACTAWAGDQVGSYNNVIAYSNNSSDSGGSNYVGSYRTGLKWQCVEYCRRFYYMVYGMEMGANTNANGFYGNGWGLAKAANGGTQAPVPGAILCSNSSSFGHVGIIREVGSNYIKVIQQNWSNTSTDNAHVFNMTVSNGHYTVQQAGSYAWQGWLMPPGGGVTASSAAWNSLPPSDRWYRSDERLGYHVNGDRPNTVHELIDGNVNAGYDTSDGYIQLSGGPKGWHFYEIEAWNSANSSSHSFSGRFNGGWDPDAPGATRTGGATPGVWNTSGASVDFKCNDALSGIRACHYKWDDGAFTEWVRGVDSGTVALLPGKHHLYVEAEDNAFTGSSELGNRATIDLGEYWLDNSAASVQVTSKLISSGSTIQIEITMTNPNPSPVSSVGIDLIQLGAVRPSADATWAVDSIPGQSSVKKTFTFSTSFGTNKSLMVTANYHFGTNKGRAKSRVVRP